MSEQKIVKFFRAVVRNINEEEHTAEVVISGEQLDRYKERVMTSAFKKAIPEFMKHAVMLSSHAYRGLLNQIGEYVSIKIDNKNKEIVAKPKWYVGEGNPEADWGWKLAQKGMAAFSIGFIPLKYKNYTDEEREESGGSWRDYLEIDLLEASQVLVPAYAPALQRDINESKDEEMTKYYEEVLLVMAKDLKEEEEPVKEEDPVEEGEGEGEVEDKGWEETTNEIRHRLQDPSLFSAFRYSGLKKDKPRVFAIYGKQKSDSKWAIQALRFPKADGWTMASAKEWVKAHSDIGKDFEWPDYIADFEDAELAMNFEHDPAASLTLFFRKGFVESIEGVMKELIASVKALEAKMNETTELSPLIVSSVEEKEEVLVEKEVEVEKVLDTDKEKEDNQSEEDLELKETLSEEKLAEMRAILMGTESNSDSKNIRKMFDDLVVELSEKFSDQSKRQ